MATSRKTTSNGQSRRQSRRLSGALERR
jgi:hypothetical protein